MVANPIFIHFQPDDQGAIVDPSYMPNFKQRVFDHGINFTNCLDEFSLCAPSRTGGDTGKTSHYTGVTNNNPPSGGYYGYQLLEDNMLPTWADDAGYLVGHFDKLINKYGNVAPTHIPPGYGIWAVNCGHDEFGYFNGEISVWDGTGPRIGTVTPYTGTDSANYRTNVFRGYVVDAIAGLGPTQKAYLRVWPGAPHKPADPDPQDVGKFSVPASFTGTGAGTNLTVSGLSGPGLLWKNAIIAGSGVPAGCVIVEQTSGTPNGNGVYVTSLPIVAAGDALTAQVRMPQSPAFNEPDRSDKPLYVQNVGNANPTSTENLWWARLECGLSIDRLIGAIFDAVDALGRLGDLYFAFNPDNGFSSGDHGFPGKENAYYSGGLVALVFMGPGIPEGIQCDKLVWNLDITPTIVEVLGLTAGRTLDGISLVPLFADQNIAWRTALTVSCEPDDGFTVNSIRTDNGFMYAEWNSATYGFETELYDRFGVLGPADPYELENRAGFAAYIQIQDLLTTQLHAMMVCDGATCKVTVPFETEPGTQPVKVWLCHDQPGFERLTVIPTQN